tara:strand:+ start:925 stop:1782 length:858 start_codon:yes stop_codon:yes gene_type:complete
MDRKFDIRVNDLTEYQPTTNEPIDKFCREVRKSISGIKFGTETGRSDYYKFVHMEGHPYPMGYLQFGDPRENAERQLDHFCVSSPNICNDKYADYNDNYNMKMSVNMHQAIRNAKAYLRPIPWGVVAQKEYSSINHEFEQVRRKFAHAYSECQHKIGLEGGNREKMALELVSLVENGHTFLDKELHDNVLDMVAKRKEWFEDKQKKLNLYFVYAYMKWGNETYVVCTKDVNYVGSWADMPYEEYSVATLPEEIKGKVMSLNVLEGVGFVDDVGYKAGDNMFYVIQ